MYINFEYDPATDTNLFWIGEDDDIYHEGPFGRLHEALRRCPSDVDYEQDVVSADRHNEMKENA